ncbi:MAG TPA: sensor histidine kinase [Candidatus Obscuribacterales bacterium]
MALGLTRAEDRIESGTVASWVRNIELAGISLIFVCQALALHLIERQAEPPFPSWSIAFLLLLACASFVPTARLSQPLRLLLVTVELVLLSAAAATGVPRLFMVLYLVLVARAAIMLEKRFLVPAIVIAVGCHLLAKIAHYGLTQPWFFALSLQQQVIHVLVFGRLINFVLGLVVVVVCVSVLLSEREARIRREQLNAEVEELSRKLERSRIAREIHDSVGHTLTSLNMQLDYLQRVFTKAPEKVEATLSEVRALAQAARRELQTSISASDELLIDLNAAVEALAEDYRQQKLFELEIDLTVPALSKEARHELFSIIKESLNNAKKYSQASHVRVRMSHDGEDLLLAIEDDGQGFNCREVKNTSFGLGGMRERARAIGGELTIDTSPGLGTRINVRVPSVAAGSGGRLEVDNLND